MQKASRFLSMFICAVMLCTLTVPALAETYTGTARGFGGDVTVTITVEDGRITVCTAEGNAETPGIGSKAIEQLPAAIVEAGSADVDGVSGATFTSDAIKAAAQAALALANGEAAATAFVPGTYHVSAMACNGLIELDVTLSENAIEAIEVTSQQETIGIGDEAIAMVTSDILAYQTLDVDTVSSATLSSNAVKSAVAQALTLAGGNESILNTVTKADDTLAVEDCTAEAVIIGGGAAGMTAAIKAAQKGVQVILLEKMDLLGGTSVMAGVGTQAGSSKLQLAKENPYTADEFFEYLKGLGHKDEKIATIAPISEDYAHTLAYRSGEMMDWLSEIGLPMRATADHSNAHSLTSTENGLFGEQLVRALKAQLTEAGVDVRMASRATEIVMENGAVAGVKVSSDHGDYTIHTNYAAICTGGYGGGEEALKAFAPSRLGYVSTEAVSNTGDGLFLASKAGGALANVEVITYRTIATGVDNVGGAIGLHNAVNAGAIYVNSEGKRFVNEAGASEAVVLAIQAQQGGEAWVVMDQAAMDERYNVSGLYIPGTYDRIFTKADTLDELAEKMNVPADALKETVAAYAEAVKSQNDTAFGREKFLLSTLENGPYYACSGKPSNHICAGGIVTDGKAQVLTEAGEVIPGLYAAGETVNLAYHPLCSALTYGMVAAEQIAAQLNK